MKSPSGPEPSTEVIAHLNSALRDRYHVERVIGVGGMAVVYLARDLKHERHVALKMLKPALSAVVGAERFLAEIKTTAKLQHPHILPLHDSGEVDGALFFVAPYVEGETVRDRISREGPIDVDEAVQITQKVASALHYAHSHGTLHRDIKPGNILLGDQNEPIVADFGLAVAFAGATDTRLTETGVRLGTPHYMSPEQVTGNREPDARSDLYALGCVLYEMLAGEPPYTGVSAETILSKVVAGSPMPLSARRRSVPPNVDAAVRKVLEKAPADRFRDAHEFMRALNDPDFRYGREAVLGPGSPTRLWRNVSLGLGACLLAVLVVMRPWVFDDPPSQVMHVAVGVQPAAVLGGPNQVSQTAVGPVSGLRLSRTAFAISPDGRRLVFSAQLPSEPNRQPETRLYVRDFGQETAVALPGTEGGVGPFFSPDGAWVGFWAQGELKKVALAGGLPVILAKTLIPFGATWSARNEILFGRVEFGGLHRVSADGGTPEEITQRDRERGEYSHRLPHALPGGDAVLFTIRKRPLGGWQDSEIAVQSLKTGERKVLIQNGADARYLTTGHLLYLRLGTLMVAPFDIERLEVTGGSTEVVRGVLQSANTTHSARDTGAGQFAVSESGTLVYLTGGIEPDQKRSLLWVDRNGAAEKLPLEPDTYHQVRVSPDGERVAILKGGPNSGLWNVWIYDLTRGTLSRFTEDGHSNSVEWSPDSTFVVFGSDRNGIGHLFRRRADSSAPLQALTTDNRSEFAGSWSRQGDLAFVLGVLDPPTYDVWIRPAGEGGKPFGLIESTSFLECDPAFSPDGRWLAYVSNSSGRNEVYVSAYPATEQHPISVEGGVGPTWSPDGRELFFVQNGAMMGVTVETTPRFKASIPVQLFPAAAGWLTRTPTRNHDIAPNGRFLMIRSEPTEPPAWVRQPGWGSQLNVVLNWHDELKRLVRE